MFSFMLLPIALPCRDVRGQYTRDARPGVIPPPDEGKAGNGV
jgi:hypothetical protein